MELLKIYLFSMFNRIGLFRGSKFIFYNNENIEFGDFIILKNILNKVTVKLCHCYLQIRF
jgi:hypothetical protein